MVTFVELYVNLIQVIEFIILFRLIELMFKTVILNLPRFQEKHQTVLYGLVLGLGFGSIYPPVSLLLINTLSVSTFEVFSVLIGSIGMLLIQGSTGALIGYGVFKRKLIMPVAVSLVFHVIFQYLLFELIFSWTWLLLIGGIITYWVILQKIVFPVLKQSKKRKRTEKTKKD
jgi:MFS family permease